MGIFSVISLLGGLSIFLYGMDIMGDGLKSSSSKALKSMLEKVTHSADERGGEREEKMRAAG